MTTAHWKVSIFWVCCCSILVVLTSFQSTFAQGYPVKSITLVVAFPPGASTDAFARIAGRRMSELLGHQIVVVNRDGAAGTTGTAYVAKAAPDGYTLLWASSGNVTIAGAWIENLPYDPIRDFSPIGGFAKIPFFLAVHPSLPAHSVEQLVTLARMRPGQLNYGSSGNGSINHLATELLKVKTKININHIPYRGAAPFSTDLLGGQIEIGIVGSTTAIPHSNSGRLRVLATTASKRVSLLKNVPTLAEAGVSDYEFTQWYGVLAPKSTPNEIVMKLSDILRVALDDQTLRKQIAAEAGVAMPATSAQFTEFLKEDLSIKKKLIKDSGIKRD